jgi:sterol 3beta-glucosyltransferase
MLSLPGKGGGARSTIGVLMKIAILAVGTQGNVQPYVALGLGLRAAGHHVTIATSTNLQDFVKRSGLDDCAAVVGDTRRWTAWLSRGRSRAKPGVLMPSVARTSGRLQGMLEEFFANSVEAARGADLIVSAATGYCVGQPVARKLQIQHCSAFVQPFHPTRAYPQLFWPELPDRVRAGRRAYNLATHQATLGGLRLVFGRTLRRARQRTLGTPVHRYTRDPLAIYGYSPAWLPKPPDWPPGIHVTGYWFLDSQPDWKPDPGLLDFLNAGQPPVYIGFGSLAGLSPEIMDLAVTAARRAGLRALISTGWSSWRPAVAGDDIHVIDEVPHEWLFPRVAAVAHHAGSGTTGAGLRAGRPTVTIPFMYDQFFFARQVAGHGLGPRPLSVESVTAASLGDAITRATQRGVRSRAAALGERIRAEAGVDRAVELIEEYAGGTR